MPRTIVWTKEEDEFIKANFQKMSYEEMAEHINKNPRTICNHAKYSLQITTKKNHPNRITDREKEYVMENWDNMTIVELANGLGVSQNRASAIADHLKRKGIIEYKRVKLPKKLKRVCLELKDIKSTIRKIANFDEADMYDIADEVEAILEVIKERLQEGIE